MDEIISENEFVLLYDHYQSKNPDFNYENNSRFDFDDLEEAECRATFRVEKRHLHDLADAFQNVRCSTNQNAAIVYVQGARTLFDTSRDIRRLAAPLRHPKKKG